MPPFSLFLASLPSGVTAQDHRHTGSTSPYAGWETRAIKSLSNADIEELRRGGGWGLALAAELNGAPGPAHLLELKDEIWLSADQVAEISAIHAAMKHEAMAVGERFIAAEEAIERAFVRAELDEEQLRSLIEQSAAARAELRFVHLSRHLLTPPLLTDAQVERYEVLRGYSPDQCASVPEGHDPAIWRRHNGCDR